MVSESRPPLWSKDFVLNLGSQDERILNQTIGTIPIKKS